MNRLSLIIAFVVFYTLSSCGQTTGNNSQNSNTTTTQSNEPPACDCCVFDEVKEKKLSHKTQIAPDSVKGERIRITGVVYHPVGTPAAGLKMYFYHTNNNGKYGKIGTEDRSSHAWWHSYCRGWLITNDKGEYEINTIKPVAYPNGNEPAHIHSSFYKADRSCEHLVDFVFKGDPFLNSRYWDRTRQYWKREGIEGDPEYGGVELIKNASGVLEGRRDIRLKKID